MVVKQPIHLGNDLGFGLSQSPRRLRQGQAEFLGGPAFEAHLHQDVFIAAQGGILQQ